MNEDQIVHRSEFPTGFLLCIVIALLLTAGGLEFAGTAHASDFHWINAGGGDWSNTNNWTPSVIHPPGNGDNVDVTLAETCTVNGLAEKE